MSLSRGSVTARQRIVAPTRTSSVTWPATNVPAARLPSLDQHSGSNMDLNKSYGYGSIELPPLDADSRSGDSDTAESPKRRPVKARGLTMAAKSHHSHFSPEDSKPKIFNPEPVPYQSQSFSIAPLKNVCVIGQRVKLPSLSSSCDGVSEGAPSRPALDHVDRSCTTVKKVGTGTTPRHGDMWSTTPSSLAIGPQHPPSGKSRDLIIHAERQAPWDDARFSECGSSSASQRERLQTEIEYMEKMRGLKRYREFLPHRAPMDFYMGGRKAMFCERMDIMTEIKKLKTVALPQRAQDLFVGRGFKLPDSHALNRVRNKPSRMRHYGPRDVGLIRPHKLPPLIAAFDQNPTNRLPQDNRKEEPTVIPEPEVVAPAADTAPATEPSDPPPVLPVEKAADDEDEDTPATQPPNPLRGCDISDVMTTEDRDVLQKRFTQLIDSDGHLSYDAVRSELPTELSESHHRFIKQIYDATSGHASMGEQEFLMLNCLSKNLMTMSEPVKVAYEKIDFDGFSSELTKYTDMFASLDRQETGKIVLSSLKDLLSTIKGNDVTKDVFEKVRQDLQLEEEEAVHRLSFLTYIPYFTTL